MRTVDFVRAVELAKQGADVRPVSNPDRKLVVTEVGEHPMLRSVKHPTHINELQAAPLKTEDLPASELGRNGTKPEESGRNGTATVAMLAPISLRAANDFVAKHHRHSGRTARNGGKFAISVCLGPEVVGIAIVGNPLSATYMDGKTAEVLRVCVSLTAPRNACSMLYGAAWRAWRAMGGTRMITYTLPHESGASLRAAGWINAARTRPVRAGWNKKDHLERKWQQIYAQVKLRWEVGRTPRGPTQDKLTNNTTCARMGATGRRITNDSTNL